LLFQKGRTSKSEPLKSRIIQALEGKADLNRDEIVTGAELVDFLKQGFGKKDSMLYGKLFQKGVHGDFLFSIQHPAVHFRANLMRPLNKGATPLEPKLTPFIKLTPKELEQNIYWPPNETEKTSVSIKEETFVEHRILGEE